jgi:[NiFe] hydrogenase assembly HybE family chaperone
MSGFAADPGPRLEEIFRHILDTRMREVPLLNPALGVEAVGFQRTSHGWLGVMITPWFMNLMLVPAEGAAWSMLPLGEKRRVKLPAGTFEFFGGREDSLGEYLYCSMFSPMSQFADHGAARATALELTRMVFDPAVGEQVRELNPSGLKWFEVQPAKPAAPAAGEISESKRAFLRGGRPRKA